MACFKKKRPNSSLKKRSLDVSAHVGAALGYNHVAITTCACLAPCNIPTSCGHFSEPDGRRLPASRWPE